MIGSRPAKPNHVHDGRKGTQARGNLKSFALSFGGLKRKVRCRRAIEWYGMANLYALENVVGLAGHVDLYLCADEIKPIVLGRRPVKCTDSHGSAAVDRTES